MLRMPWECGDGGGDGVRGGCAAGAVVEHYWALPLFSERIDMKKLIC